MDTAENGWREVLFLTDDTSDDETFRSKSCLACSEGGAGTSNQPLQIEARVEPTQIIVLPTS